MKKITVTLECESLSKPLHFNLKCDAHDEKKPCTIRLLLSMLRAADEVSTMTTEEFEASAREAAFDVLAEKGGEKDE